MAHAQDRLRVRGFTLLELLVAISILALIAVISWRGISSLAATRERLEPQSDQVHSVLAGFGQIERDLAQAPVNAVLFALPGPSVRVLTVDGHASLQIVRLCPSNDGSAATAVQTVLYRLRDGALQRQSTAPQRYLSIGASFSGEGVPLVPQVDDIQVRVWKDGTGWITPGGDADTANTAGVEVRLMRRDGTSIRGVFAVG